jgi:hypothetical protein
MIRPVFGPSGAPSVINTDAGNGAFGLGLAFGSGDTFWGKSLGVANDLRHMALDLNNFTATTLRVVTGYPNMTAIGVNAANNLLAGVSVETPDNLRLFEIGDTLVHVDTEFFPTDNPNVNATGAVSFGPGRVYALDSNNGIIALALASRLNLTRNGNQLVLTWSGSSVLQSSADVTGPYEDVPNATPGYTVDLTSGTQMFYRLKD